MSAGLGMEQSFALGPRGARGESRTEPHPKIVLEGRGAKIPQGP